MKFRSCFFLFIFFLHETPILSLNNPKDIYTEFKIIKGVNIGNWLEGQNSNVIPNISKMSFGVEDVDSIAMYGFDHIRLPISERMILKEKNEINSEVMMLVHKILRQCEKRKLKVIFDLHGVNYHDECFLDRVSEREKYNLLRIWRVLLNELEQYPVEMLAYELLNKPNMKTDDQWNNISNALIKYIRKRNTRRVIILGSNNNTVDKIDKLEIPRGDPNIIISFHFYEPSLLTKYRAAYAAFGRIKFKEKLVYPGFLVSDSNYYYLNNNDRKIVEPYRNYYNRNTIKSRLKKAVAYSKNNGAKLYLSEFGCLPNNGVETQNAWIKDIVSVCRELNIAYCLWEYNSGFGFIDRKTKKIRNSQMLDILTK